jgi:hypothetical protein
MQQVPQLPVSQEEATDRPARRSACRIDDPGSTSMSAPVEAILTLKDGSRQHSSARKRSKWTRFGPTCAVASRTDFISVSGPQQYTCASGRQAPDQSGNVEACAPGLTAIMHFDVFLRQRADAFGEDDVGARAHAVMQFETQSRRKHSSIIDRNGVMPIPPAIITCGPLPEASANRFRGGETETMSRGLITSCR